MPLHLPYYRQEGTEIKPSSSAARKTSRRINLAHHAQCQQLYRGLKTLVKRLIINQYLQEKTDGLIEDVVADAPYFYKNNELRHVLNCAI